MAGLWRSAVQGMRAGMLPQWLGVLHQRSHCVGCRPVLEVWGGTGLTHCAHHDGDCNRGAEAEVQGTQGLHSGEDGGSGCCDPKERAPEDVGAEQSCKAW